MSVRKIVLGSLLGAVLTSGALLPVVALADDGQVFFNLGYSYPSYPAYHHYGAPPAAVIYRSPVYRHYYHDPGYYCPPPAYHYYGSPRHFKRHHKHHGHQWSGRDHWRSGHGSKVIIVDD